MTGRVAGGAIVLAWMACLPVAARAQTPVAGPTTSFSRWEVSLDGRVGAPGGTVKVTEATSPGTRLNLRSDLGITVSEAVEAGVAFFVTPRDAIRATLLNYFLDGSATIDRPFNYNGPTFPAGHVSSTLDYWRFSLGYERQLLALGAGGRLAGSLGLTYVSLDAVVHGNHEDFFRQELPVPIVGLRADYPLAGRLGLTASVSGGALPRVDSLRKEGGTVWLRQSHADAGLGLAYDVTHALQVRAGYHFTYFFQEEKSHEDTNTFELTDHGFQAGLQWRF